jgi:hypothetical protein
MMVGTAAAAASGANNPKLQDEYAEEQTHDDFFAYTPVATPSDNGHNFLSESNDQSTLL